jgi:hypothetical protein
MSMPSREAIDRIKRLGLRKSYIIKNTVERLQRELHLTHSQMNSTFPDLMNALEREETDNMQRSHLMVQVKVIHRFRY